jgi:hypothetical protein
MVTTFSALSSSSDARMRLSRSLCGAGFLGETAAFFAATTGLLAEAAGFLRVGCLTDFADFFAGTFFAGFAPFALAAAGFLPAGFLVRVRAKGPQISGGKV